MKEIIKIITDAPINAWITLCIGFFAGGMIVSLYFIDIYIKVKRENNQMRECLGRPIK